MVSGFGFIALVLACYMGPGMHRALSPSKRRMTFAREIGAKIIHTNAPELSKECIFYKNMETLADFAAGLGPTIALGNPGNGQRS
jgi:hypothetical protein